MPSSSEPKVSVIVPVFNGAGSIGRALSSVISQTERDIEILVVDDGSTDDLTAALVGYLDQITLIRQSNAGAAAARNRGVAHSRAPLLAFLDADDFWHPRKLEYQIAAFERWPQTALCYTRLSHVAPNFSPPGGEVLPSPIDSTRKVPSFEDVFADPYFGTPAVMMRRDVFLRHKGFREDLQSAEDVDLWLRASYSGEVAQVSVPLTYVVPTPGSLSRRQGAAAFGNNLRVIDIFCRDHPEFARRSAQTIRRARALVLRNWASHELVAGNATRARSLAADSLRCHLSWRAAFLMLKAQFRP